MLITQSSVELEILNFNVYCISFSLPFALNVVVHTGTLASTRFQQCFRSKGKSNPILTI